MWNYMKVAFQLTFQTIPACFFFFLPSAFLFHFSPIYAFFLFSRPLPVLSFQEVKMLLLVSLQNFPAIFF